MQDRTAELGDACDDAVGLEGAVAGLRADVPVRPAFRARFHDALAREAEAATTIRIVPRRGWYVRPLTAAAAAVGFTILGAAGGSVLVSRASDGAGAGSIAGVAPSSAW